MKMDEDGLRGMRGKEIRGEEDGERELYMEGEERRIGGG